MQHWDIFFFSMKEYSWCVNCAGPSPSSLPTAQPSLQFIFVFYLLAGCMMDWQVRSGIRRRLHRAGRAVDQEIISQWRLRAGRTDSHTLTHMFVLLSLWSFYIDFYSFTGHFYSQTRPLTLNLHLIKTLVLTHHWYFPKWEEQFMQMLYFKLYYQFHIKQLF